MQRGLLALEYGQIAGDPAFGHLLIDDVGVVQAALGARGGVVPDLDAKCRTLGHLATGGRDAGQGTVLRDQLGVRLAGRGRRGASTWSWRSCASPPVFLGLPPDKTAARTTAMSTRTTAEPPRSPMRCPRPRALNQRPDLMIHRRKIRCSGIGTAVLGALRAHRSLFEMLFESRITGAKVPETDGEMGDPPSLAGTSLTARWTMWIARPRSRAC